MARLFVRLMLGLLTTMAVVLPFVLNKRNYDPALQRAQDVVKQTQDRAKALEDLAAGAPSAPDTEPAERTELSEAAQEVQQISRDTITKGTMTPAEAERLRTAMERLARERRELADQ